MYKNLSDAFKDYSKLVVTDCDEFVTDYTEENFPEYLNDEIFKVDKAEGDTLYVHLYSTGCQLRDALPRRNFRGNRKVRTGRKS